MRKKYYLSTVLLLLTLTCCSQTSMSSFNSSNISSEESSSSHSSQSDSSSKQVPTSTYEEDVKNIADIFYDINDLNDDKLIQIDDYLLSKGLYKAMGYKSFYFKTKFIHPSKEKTYIINDPTLYYDVIATTDYIKTSDRNFILENLNNDKEGIKEYLINQGYTLKNSITISTADKNIVNKPLYHYEGETLILDYIDSYSFVDNYIHINLKDADIKDKDGNFIRKLTDEDFEYSINPNGDKELIYHCSNSLTFFNNNIIFPSLDDGEFLNDGYRYEKNDYKWTMIPLNNDKVTISFKEFSTDCDISPTDENDEYAFISNTYFFPNTRSIMLSPYGGNEKYQEMLNYPSFRLALLSLLEREDVDSLLMYGLLPTSTRIIPTNENKDNYQKLLEKINIDNDGIEQAKLFIKDLEIEDGVVLYTTNGSPKVFQKIEENLKEVFGDKVTLEGRPVDFESKRDKLNNNFYTYTFSDQTSYLSPYNGLDDLFQKYKTMFAI